jgi:hypothetical protein
MRVPVLVGSLRASGRWRVGVVLCSLVAWSGACSEGGKELPAGVVARVGKHDLAWSVFSDYVEHSVGASVASLDSAALVALFEQFLDEELLRVTAVDGGLVSAEASRAKAASALLAAAESEPVPEEELVAYYQEHQAELALPPRIRLVQWLFEDRSAAESASAEGLPPVSDDTGDETEGLRGVELGELGRDDLPEKLARQLFELEVGEASGVIDTGAGYSVFLVRQRWEAETPSLERVRNQLSARLRAQRTSTARARLIAEARERYNVVIVASRLPFELPRNDDALAP